MQKVVTLTMVNVQSLDEPSARLKDVSRIVVHFKTELYEMNDKAVCGEPITDNCFNAYAGMVSNRNLEVFEAIENEA